MDSGGLGPTGNILADFFLDYLIGSRKIIYIFWHFWVLTTLQWSPPFGMFFRPNRVMDMNRYPKTPRYVKEASHMKVRDENKMKGTQKKIRQCRSKRKKDNESLIFIFIETQNMFYFWRNNKKLKKSQNKKVIRSKTSLAEVKHLIQVWKIKWVLLQKLEQKEKDKTNRKENIFKKSVDQSRAKHSTIRSLRKRR